MKQFIITPAAGKRLIGKAIVKHAALIAAIKKGICYATVLASFNVEGFGVEKTSMLTKAMIEKRLRAFVKFISV